MRYLYDILFSKSIIWQGNDRKFRACKYVQKHIRSITTEEKEVENGLLEFMAKHFIVYTFISHHQNLLTSIASMQMQKALVFLFIFFILNYYYQFMKSFYICHNAAHFLCLQLKVCNIKCVDLLFLLVQPIAVAKTNRQIKLRGSKQSTHLTIDLQSVKFSPFPLLK